MHVIKKRVKGLLVLTGVRSVPHEALRTTGGGGGGGGVDSGRWRGGDVLVCVCVVLCVCVWEVGTCGMCF